MLRFFLLAALLAVSSPSDADTCICNHAPATWPATTNKGCKLVILDFDGPTKLADASRGVFMRSLGLRYDLVPQKRWDLAFDPRTDQHGVRRWQAAAKRTGVNAIVEGWIQDEGSRHTMTINVRDATTGTSVDSLSVKVSDSGVAADSANLLGQLDDVLEWVDCSDPRKINTPLIF
jgi:hypothetical protein